MVKHVQMSSVITPKQQNKEVSEHSYSCDLNSALYSICPNLTPSGQGGCLWSLPLFCVSSRPPFKFSQCQTLRQQTIKMKYLVVKKNKKNSSSIYSPCPVASIELVFLVKVQIKVQPIQVFWYLTIIVARMVAN